jgi:hypothetical protein
VSPSATSLNLNATRWPSANRRRTLIYPTGLTATTFTNQLTDAAIQGIYTASASGTSTGEFVGPVATGQVYVFRTDETNAAPTTPPTPYRYGLLLVVGVPASTTTTSTASLQLQVRMAK